MFDCGGPSKTKRFREKNQERLGYRQMAHSAEAITDKPQLPLLCAGQDWPAPDEPRKSRVSLHSHQGPLL